MEVSIVFQWCFKRMSRKISKRFKEVSRVFWDLQFFQTQTFFGPKNNYNFIFDKTSPLPQIFVWPEIFFGFIISLGPKFFQTYVINIYEFWLREAFKKKEKDKLGLFAQPPLTPPSPQNLGPLIRLNFFEF